MTNTQLRVISAFVMVTILVASIAGGQQSTLVLIGIIGALVVEEIIKNFLGLSRKSFNYIFSMSTYIAGFAFFNFFKIDNGFYNFFVNAAFFLNLLLLGYLFLAAKDSKLVFQLFNKLTFLVGLIILIPFMSIASLIQFDNWIYLIGGVIIINFTVDSAAWLFGRNFGKNKLWPAVSPNKTVEGFVGGVVSSVIVGVIYWNFLIGELNFLLINLFIILACCAQLGDLVQSKLKRQFDVKDSSQLIPGHGGVYDRVDSLLFVVPFYATIIRIFLIA